MDDPQVRPLLARPLRPGELVALDALAAVGYTLLLFLSAAGAGSGDARALLFAAGIGLPVTLRRRWPWPTFAVTLAASAGAMAFDVVREPFVAAAYALYLAALRTPRRRREPTVAIAAVSVVGVLSVTVAGPGTGARALPGLLLVGCVLLGGAWTVGRAVRERRAYAARTAEQLADRAAAEERLRIAREVHDVVSHTLSMIGVKAGIANHVADARPQEAREALRVIEATSRDALLEMRRMLTPLRSDQPVGSGIDQAGPDQAGPEALARLAERAGRAGVPVELTFTGADHLPGDVARSVHRIVQEAVTNVVRHAAPARCQVVVDATGEGVRVEVTDDGAGRAAAAEPGYGLIGMRERAARHGGTFAAGPRPGGGFAVSAWIPYQAVAAT